jgi:hypothetical protein
VAGKAACYLPYFCMDLYIMEVPMKSDLFNDISMIKEIDKKTSGFCLIKDVLSKNVGARLLTVLFFLSCVLFIILQYHYKDDISILFVILAMFLAINFVILRIFNKIIDSHIKNELVIDKKTKDDSFHLSYLLFINRLENKDISINKLEIIIEQFVLQNKNNKIYQSKIVIFISGILIFIFHDFIQKTLSDFIKEIPKETANEPSVTFVIIAFGFFLIIIFDILHFLFNREKYINDSIIRKLKQYVNYRKYEMLE